MENATNVITSDAIYDKKAEVYSGYIEHARDTRLGTMLRDLVENVEACRCGAGSRRRALFLIGASGSGKSFALRHHFSRIPAFQPWKNEFGETVRPLLSIEAPKPCTTKDFAMAILDAIGVPSKAKMTEGQLFATVKAQLRERGIIYLHVDEAQHLLRHSRSRAILDVQDRLKSLMQIEDWPLHTIYSGMPELAELLTGDQQLANRSMVMRFIPLSLPGDKASIAQVLADIVEGKCGLNLTDELRTDDFLGRLCTANSGCYGKIIEAVQAACFLVMHKGKGTVDRRAFAHNYQRDTGCLPSDNVFTAARWSEIDPGNALADLATAGKGGK
ncbi:type II secretory pathway predicted ATPase ExeA [Agrobacterium tumefaciens]|jgi:type II secretory pathway predicted ATPase ExeA|uniref:ATP-binding protein n=1 Tax=Agrobacterium tumefaciens TaxID=358 RepID=UPI000DD0386E|nr:ATP-binding protein [Agrobacterium tumefaciens]MBP2511309.1 type II secretory pathway predicted ATPase ExeA [Agrobacterium tumefaciens]MBP2520560.1 type II secretory pathway predicted ATPase ExeA [Agrobacterium tumefaciens]MBP2579229.1 type II secretory pathway predicted ATPase ExeA [Agrobacterium tumefaciens]MBP2597522.1 type II secretory pathway predicted ATPase ExeA [Agrobacterium tumefaciens]